MGQLLGGIPVASREVSQRCKSEPLTVSCLAHSKGPSPYSGLRDTTNSVYTAFFLLCQLIAFPTLHLLPHCAPASLASWPFLKPTDHFPEGPRTDCSLSLQGCSSMAYLKCRLRSCPCHCQGLKPTLRFSAAFMPPDL